MYGKLFKRYLDDELDIIFNEYIPDEQKYYRLIEEALKRGEKQVIINSEIMIAIIFDVIGLSGIILDIEMSDNTDKVIKDNVKKILSKMRTNNIEFVKLKEILEWSNSKDSIDIMSIDIYYDNDRYTIKSNGVFYCVNDEKKNLNHILDKLLKKIVEKLILWAI